MRRFLALALVLAACAGCRTPYVVTLYNGTTVTTRGKPKYQDGYYTWKDSYGRDMHVQESRVKGIEPKSGWNEGSSFYSP